VNQQEFDSLDRTVDSLGTQAHPDADLVRGLAQLSDVEWPDRAVGGKVAAQVGVALHEDRSSDGNVVRLPRRRPIRTAVRLSKAQTLVAAAAVILTAAGLISANALGPQAPSQHFFAQFAAPIVGQSTQGPQASGSGWQLAAAIIVPGWRATLQHSPADALSCPTVSVCYMNAASFVGGHFQNFNILETSTDSGRSWTARRLPADVNLSTALQCPQSTMTCLVAGSDAGKTVLLKTTNGGRTWSAHRLAWANSAPQLVCLSNQRCLGIFGTGPAKAMAPRFELRRTTDGGRTWSAGPAAPHGQVADYLACSGKTCALFDQSNFYNCGESCTSHHLTIWYSRDDGVHWVRTGNPPGAWPQLSNGTPAANTMSCADARSCWAIMTTSANLVNPAAIAATTDGGAHWKVQALPARLANINAMAISCPTVKRCFVGGSDLRPTARPLMLTTNDSGATWSRMRLPSVTDAQPSPPGVVISLMSCPAAGHCVAVAWSYNTQTRVYTLGAAR